MLIDPQGNTMRFQTDTLDYDDLGPDMPFGPEFDLGSITSIETAYAVRHPKPKLDGYLSMLGGAAMGGVLGAAVMGYFYAKDRGRVVCYTNVQLAGHGDTVFKFIADEPIVDKVILIIEEKNYFGHREPNLTPRYIRWLENVFMAIGVFFRRLFFTVIAILVFLVIIVLIFGKFPFATRDGFVKTTGERGFPESERAVRTVPQRTGPFAAERRPRARGVRHDQVPRRPFPAE